MTQKPGVRIIDLTVDEDAAKSAALKAGATNVLQQQLIRAALPGQVTPSQSSSFLLASSPAGTQLVTQTGLTATRPAGVYQYVISSSTPGVRPGSLVTMLPSNATFRPAVTTAVSAPPQLRAIGQSVTSVVRPPVLTRPPPPLYSAPTGQATVTKVRAHRSKIYFIVDTLNELHQIRPLISLVAEVSFVTFNKVIHAFEIDISSIYEANYFKSNISI